MPRALCLVALLAAFAHADPVPTFYEPFDDGNIEGPVGAAGPRVSFDPVRIIDLDRGTIAFFYQSKDEPREREWGGIGGMTTDFDQGYWRMGVMFQTRRQEFLFNFFDAGAYSPPMVLPTIFGRWQAGQWHHLAAVWDRSVGIRFYEDGKEIFSNWGDYHWQWNLLPDSFSLAGPLDEVYVFNEPLTAQQIADLAAGKKATGDAIPVTPAAQRRERDLARMGWTGDSLASMPAASPGAPTSLHFATVEKCVDAKRPVAYTWAGLLRTNWPSFKYGPSIRGQNLEISLRPDQTYDRYRVFATRHFHGQVVRYDGRQPKTMAAIDIPHAMFRHGRLDAMHDDTAVELHRRDGQIGQFDLYRVGDGIDGDTQSFHFDKADHYRDGRGGDVLKGETEDRFENPTRATRAPGDAWQLSAPAFGGFQAATDNLPDASGYTGAGVRLVIEGITEPTPVRIEIKEPVDPERVWLAADVVLQPKGAGKQTYNIQMTGRPVISLPAYKKKKYLKDGIYSDTDFHEIPEVGFGLKVTIANPATFHMGAGGSSLELFTAPIADVVEHAADDQVEFLREAYAERMEGHLYGDHRLQTPLTWLAMFAPDRMEFRQMWERLDHRVPQIPGIDIPKLQMPDRVNDTGAPDWAFWQMQAMNEHLEHLHWIIDDKQVWTGEFGGIWNDDSTHVENWIGYMLCMDDSRKIRDAMHKFWEGLWNYQLIDGVGKFTQDSSHYSEEGTSGLGQRLLVDYGDPVAYARTLLAARRTQHWVTDDGNGGLRFKGDYTGPEGVWTEGAMAYGDDEGKGYKIPLTPNAYLIWYNRHPKSADYMIKLQGEKRGLRLSMMGTSVERATDWDAELQWYHKLLETRPGKYGPGGEGYTDAANLFPFTDAQREAQMVEYKPQPPIMHYWGSKNTEDHYWYWKVTGDDRFLVDSYKRVTEWFYSHDWLNGPAMPSMDRNPLPRGSLIRARIGATAANRGSSGNMWPLHAISFTRGANDVAALVTENLPNQFAVQFWAFTEKPHDLGLRAWRCNGTFNLKLTGEDGNTLHEQTLNLDRGMPFDLTIPQKQLVTLSVTPIDTQPENFDRPDPAISFGSVELLYGDHLVVTVYNNGTQPVDDCLVRVRDGLTGNVVINGEKHTGPIEAPLDLTPRKVMVEFKNINCNAHDRIIIELDPENEVDDFNRHNNRVDLDFQSTFKLHDRWR